jgi:hypothetical protein
MKRPSLPPSAAEEFASVYSLRVKRLCALSRVRPETIQRPDDGDKEYASALHRLYSWSQLGKAVPLIAPARSGKSAMAAELVHWACGSLAYAAMVNGVELVQAIVDANRGDVRQLRLLRRLAWTDLLVVDDADRIVAGDWRRYHVGELLKVRGSVRLTTVLVGRTLTDDMRAAL